MGSGSGGNYGSVSSGSQPYAPTYHVVSEMLAQDKKDSDIYNPNSGYPKNPTATKLTEAGDSGRVEINGKRADGKFVYVMDNDGNIIFGKRSNPNNEDKRSPHPMLIGGKDPTVQVAGIIEFRKGKIYSVDDRSGHFRPNSKSMEKVDEFMKALYRRNPELFHSKSKWRKK